MAATTLLSVQEAATLRRLAANQPRSTPALQKAIEKIKARTVRAVLADPRVAERLRGARARVVGTDFRDEKSGEDGSNIQRLAEIGIYDYDRDVLVVPVVDLRRGIVLRIEERVGVQPPLTEEELQEAKTLALADPRFRSLRRIRDLAVVAFPAGLGPLHPASRHRCFTLYLWVRGKTPRKVGEAIVDLSARRLIATETPQGPESPARPGRVQREARPLRTETPQGPESPARRRRA